jgi:hypothetical protein
MNKECPYCHEIIEGKHAIFANHVRWCKKNPNLDKKKTSENIKKGCLKELDKRLGKYKKFTVKCHNCNKTTVVEEREKQFPKKEKYFCSRSCANARVHSNETKRQISAKCRITTKKLWQDPEYIKRAVESQKSIFTSKGEFAIRKYFQWNYPKYRWSFGGCLKHNGFPLVRDLYSNILKVCIEYDGIWHFENIHNQLEYKQKQDHALEEWCVDHNFRLIRIKENIFLKNEQFWLDIITNEVFNGIAKIVKFY